MYGEAIKKNCPLQDVYASCSHQLSQRKNIPKDYRNMIETGEGGRAIKQPSVYVCACKLTQTGKWKWKLKESKLEGVRRVRN